MAMLEDISKAIESGKARLSRELVVRALEEGIDPHEILNHGLLCGLKAVGRRFSRNPTMVSDMLVSSRAINGCLEVLKPALIVPNEPTIGRACIGSVQGDLHDIGKNIVRIVLESHNIEVLDLGVDVAPEDFVRAVKEEGCDLVCCSALLSATMTEMERVVEALKNAGVRDRVIVMVGGVPVTEEYCRRIGADLYTSDGFAAGEKAEEILRTRRTQREASAIIKESM